MAEAKKRIATIEDDVKKEAEECEKVKLQLNRDSVTLQSLAKQVEDSKRKAELEAEKAKVAGEARARVQDQLSLERQKLASAEAE